MPKLDLWPLLERLSIKDKQAKVIRLTRNAPFSWAQRELVKEVEHQYNSGQPVRIAVLKGRQVGISTITEAILFLWCFLHPGTNALVLSRKSTDSEYLYGMSKRYWDEGPFFGLYRTKYYTQTHIDWAEPLSSSMRTATASTDEVGRGKTLHAVHCSEVGFWPDADSIVGGLMESIPEEHGTICVLESTAQGVGGYWYDTWKAAITPHSDSQFTPMFFPWYLHEEYSIPGSHLRYADLDDDEKELLDDFPEMTLPKLAWRRRKIAGLPRQETQFHEEYPCTEDEAFLSTGSNLFPVAKVQAAYTPTVPFDRGYLYNDGGKLAWMDSPTGHTYVYSPPDPRGRRLYVLAVDPTFSVDGDPCCIQILDRTSYEQVAVWHGGADPRTIGEISLALGLWYGNALMNTEVQGGGRVVLDVWRQANYQNIWTTRRPTRARQGNQVLAWSTTQESKAQLIGTLQAMLHRRQITLHHPATFHELCQYTHLPTDSYGPARRGGHDDCVMALGVAVVTAATEAARVDWKKVYGDAPPIYIPGESPRVVQGQGTPIDRLVAGRFGPMNSPALSGLDDLADWA
jgi:Terminase RNaseH-like domain